VGARSLGAELTGVGADQGVVVGEQRVELAVHLVRVEAPGTLHAVGHLGCTAAQYAAAGELVEELLAVEL
jgi:hypothetical protein